MFGKEFAQHISILTQSFQAMNKEYEEKVKNENDLFFINTLKKLYVSIFGIPEIGFQIRGIYFKKSLSELSSAPINNILDAGSGIGAYTFFLARTFKNANVVGGDIDKNKLKTSETIKSELKQKNVSFAYFDITKNQTRIKYDFITIIDVLEHVDNYKSALTNLRSLLSTNGYLYIHVPQPNQKRIFNSLKNWHHNDHVHEGIKKQILEKTLKKIGFKILTAHETFGIFGKFSWEINHILLSKNLILAGIFFPILYPLALLDSLYEHKNGLGVAILAQKIENK